MCLREKEKETGLAEAHDGDWDAERGPRLQWTGTQDEGGALQVLELQKSVLKEADCLHEESDAWGLESGRPRQEPKIGPTGQSGED